MKIIIEKPILLNLESAHDNLDVGDWLEYNGIDFQHSYKYSLVINPQEFVSTVAFREEFFDKLEVLGIKILLERVEHNEYRMC